MGCVIFSLAAEQNVIYLYFLIAWTLDVEKIISDRYFDPPPFISHNDKW